MGKQACVYIFGAPLFESKECADLRRNDRTDRKEIEEASDVAKKQSTNERKIANTYSRNFGTGETPLEGIAGGLIGAAQNVGCSLLGVNCNASQAMPFDPTALLQPLVIGGLGLGAIYLVTKGMK